VNTKVSGSTIGISVIGVVAVFAVVVVTPRNRKQEKKYTMEVELTIIYYLLNY